MSYIKLIYLLGLLLFHASSIQAESTTLYQATTGGIGCQYGEQAASDDGFGVTFYSYPYDDTEAGNTIDGSVSTAFFQTGYSKYDLIGVTSGVTVPTINYSGNEATTATSDLYGVGVTMMHFFLELDGYFYATVSGVYTLKLDNIDDFAAIWFGSGLPCCGETTDSDDEAAPDFATGRSDGTDSNGGSKYSIYLSAGSYYPIKVRYVNVRNAADLLFSVVEPSGNEITDFSGYVYQFVTIDSSCKTVTATLPFETTTITTNVPSTTTSTVPTTVTTNGKTITTTIVIVEEPPLSTTTVTTDVTSVTTTTAATTYTSDDQAITSSIVVVEEPPLSTTTVTTDVTSVTTTTAATTYTSDDQAITSSIVVVKESSLSTITVTTDVSSVTTTTAATTYTSNGKQVIGNVVLVEEPLLSTTTVTTDISSVTTTTAATIYTFDDQTITSSIVVVEEPSSTNDYSTTTTLSTTTVTTDVTSVTTTTAVTTYTSDDNTITSSVVIVKEPSTSFLSSSTSALLSSSSVDSETFAFYSNSTSSTDVPVDNGVISTITISTDVECSSTLTKTTVLTQNGKTTTANIVLVEEPKISEGGTLDNPASASATQAPTTTTTTTTTTLETITSSTKGFGFASTYDSSNESGSGSLSNNVGSTASAALLTTEAAGSGNSPSTTVNIENTTKQSTEKSVTVPNDQYLSVASEEKNSDIYANPTSTSSEISALSPEVSIYEGRAATTEYGIQMIFTILAVMLMGL